MEEKQEKKSTNAALFVSLNEKQLKNVAAVFMLLNTFACAILQNGILKYYSYTTEQLNERIAGLTGFSLDMLASILQIIGVIALPLIIYMLVEGFKHTANDVRYLLSLAILGIVSEIPYDLAFHHQFFFWDEQSPALALFICGAFIMLCSRFLDNFPKVPRIVFVIIATLSAIAWCMVLRISYGVIAVPLASCYYNLYEHKVAKNILGALITSLTLSGPLSLYLLYGYNGERGNIRNKYVYYLFYPVQLILLAAISYLI